MATKKPKYWAKCRYWGDLMTADMEGPATEIIRNLFISLPPEKRSEVLGKLNAAQDRLKAKEGEQHAQD